jgi:hypothetical protein
MGKCEDTFFSISLNTLLPNVVVKWLILLLRIQEAQISNIGPDYRIS